jgi:Zn-dependent protease
MGLASKGKVLLVLAPKLLLTFSSMAAMVWVEALRSGWLYGLGFVLCILVHELGHAFAIRRHGLSSSWPVFIPFVGAFITLQTQDLPPVVEAEVGLAGPVWGTAASLGAVVLYWETANRVWLAVALTGFLLNLFNLTPIRPLDGGRVAQLFSRRAWILGALILVGLFFLTWSPLLILVGLSALPRALRGGAQRQDLPEALPSDRLRLATQYFGLMGVLAAGYYFANRLLHPAGGG